VGVVAGDVPRCFSGTTLPDDSFMWYRIVSEGVNRAKAANDLGVLLITHYTRILRYIKPDFVHVFANGKIVEQGGPELADKLEANGYAEYVTA
jgi:Fe-S cluster assembly ATP-binding protein